MQQICRNCHFFAKECREPSAGTLVFPVSDKERDNLKTGNINIVAQYYSLKCQMGVWDEGLNPDKSDRLERLNNITRKNKCFFFPYNPSMMFSAAIELQKREQENQQLKRSNMYTRIGLWIAAFALLANAVIGLFSKK